MPSCSLPLFCRQVSAVLFLAVLFFAVFCRQASAVLFFAVLLLAVILSAGQCLPVLYRLDLCRNSVGRSVPSCSLPSCSLPLFVGRSVLSCSLPFFVGRSVRSFSLPLFCRQVSAVLFLAVLFFAVILSAGQCRPVLCRFLSAGQCCPVLSCLVFCRYSVGRSVPSCSLPFFCRQVSAVLFFAVILSAGQSWPVLS